MTVRLRALGLTVAGLPARIAGTPTASSASSKTSAAPLECATASTLGGGPSSPFESAVGPPRNLNAVAMRRLATLVLPVPGGPLINDTRLDNAQAIASA
mmetsp:Transcript_10019/g.28067  ORF Transcript_10019/g.28067 Transcript_10019/m.28067 type:complete len:99 (-) Transcript_10019:469-765(-)